MHTSGQLVSPPGWVKLVRKGDLFEAYSSANGSTWTKFGSDTVAMNDTVYVGLAVTSHSSGVSTTAVMDNLKVTAASTSPTNQPPAVTLTSPINGTSFTTSTTVNLAANASDPEQRLASVDFYAGSTLLPRDNTAPYSAAWSPSAAGTNALWARAHDLDGGSTDSGTVTVLSPAPRRPLYRLPWCLPPRPTTRRT